MDKLDKTPKKPKKVGTPTPIGVSSPKLIKKKVKSESSKKKPSSSAKKEEKKKSHGSSKEHHSKSSSSDKTKTPDDFDMEVEARVAIMRSELDYLCDSMKSTINLELLKVKRTQMFSLIMSINLIIYLISFIFIVTASNKKDEGEGFL